MACSRYTWGACSTAQLFVGVNSVHIRACLYRATMISITIHPSSANTTAHIVRPLCCVHAVACYRRGGTLQRFSAYLFRIRKAIVVTFAYYSVPCHRKLLHQLCPHVREHIIIQNIRVRTQLLLDLLILYIVHTVPVGVDKTGGEGR